MLLKKHRIGIFVLAESITVNEAVAELRIIDFTGDDYYINGYKRPETNLTFLYTNIAKINWKGIHEKR